MNPETFHNSTAKNLRQIGRGDAAYWAFIPPSLPPDLLFDVSMLNALSQADRALGELAGVGSIFSNNVLQASPLIRREAVSSSRIEGTRTDLSTLYAYEAGQLYLPGFTSDVPEADAREVYNYVQALEYGLERLDTLPISLRLVKELHEKLMAGVRGEQATPGAFRRSQNWIGEPGCTLNTASFVPPPVAEMHDSLNEWELYIHSNDELPPLIQLALIHYQFEAIHPFLDGNGRIGRLLNALLLIHWELLPVPLLYLSAYFEEHRTQYYDLLTAVSQRGAWKEWILFFLQGIIDQAHDTTERAKQLHNLQKKWLSILQQNHATGSMIATTNLLYDLPLISAKDVAEQLAITHQTALKTLRRLKKLNIVTEMTGQKRYLLFAAPDILQILR